jgi:low affinity Fe/Cu permease
LLQFLIVFLIQNTQNRDANAIQLNINELLRAAEGARAGLVKPEAWSDDDHLQLQARV